MCESQVNQSHRKYSQSERFYEDCALNYLIYYNTQLTNYILWLATKSEKA